MKKVCMCLVLGLVTFAWTVQSASALPPFNKAWTEKYVEGNGKAVGKFLTKAKYNEIKDDEAAGKKYILEGLQKAEAEKAANGKTYGELLKGGSLPGA